MSLLCSLLLASSLSFASDSDNNYIDYTDIAAGEVAPFSGKLLKEEALIQIIVMHDKEVKKLKVDHTFEISKISSDFQLKHDLLNLKYTSEVEMYKTMITARDEQLRIDSRKDVLQKWGTYGAFILGALTTVAVVHAVDHIE